MIFLRWVLLASDTTTEVVFVKRVIGERLQYHPLYKGREQVFLRADSGETIVFYSKDGTNKDLTPTCKKGEEEELLFIRRGSKKRVLFYSLDTNKELIFFEGLSGEKPAFFWGNLREEATFFSVRFFRWRLYLVGFFLY